MSIYKLRHILALAAVLAALWGCGGEVTQPVITVEGPGGSTDGSTGSGSSTAYSALNDSSKWSAGPRGLDTFAGGAFDGRYVYFAPTGTIVTRYDTQAPGGLANLGAWTTFDTTALAAGEFFGAAFDGRYLYLVPNQGKFVARYDTTASFTTGDSWTTFDVTSVTKTALEAGFAGAVFDGRYIYLVPNDGRSFAARYDTQAPFMGSASWSAFDMRTVSPDASGFLGGVFDGRYVYFVPFVHDPGRNDESPHGLVARYDTVADFATGTSWSTFDMTAVNPQARRFHGGVFDGRYVYFVPSTYGAVARYDTQESFKADTSWETFAGAPGEWGYGAFDGRYVYFPGMANHPADDEAEAVARRYDTQGPFTAPASWSSFFPDPAERSTIFGGAVFDGRYLYVMDDADSFELGTRFVRFDAKTPPALPAGYAHGSFF